MFSSIPSDQSHSIPMGPVQLDDEGYRDRSHTSSHQMPKSLGEAPVKSVVVSGKLSDGELVRSIRISNRVFLRYLPMSNWGILRRS